MFGEIVSIKCPANITKKLASRWTTKH